MRIDTSALDRMAAELGAKAEQAVRPAAQAGADVLYRAARANAERIRDSGRLAASIYQAYSARKSGPLAATYQISWRTGSGGPRAPHGHWIEYGRWMYYKARRLPSGQWVTMVRPEMRGKPNPKGDRRSNRAAFDAYYIPLAAPKWVPASPFIRPAFAQADQALRAAEAEFMRRVNIGGGR